MLSLGKFPTNVRHGVIPRNPEFPSKYQFRFSIRLHLNGAVSGNLRNGLYRAAQKTKKKGEFSVAEMNGPDDFEDDFGGGLEGGDDGEEVVIPLKNMREWLENRPRGFGEGKVYDTSVEDKLVEEIEQSRKAQLVNVNKLKDKDSPLKPGAKKETGISDTHNGFQVRLTNLPKKKNIHKDLRLAFNEVPGILRITPVVSGNEKTRDPVCKGLAFVDFKHLAEAQRFVQSFSGRSVSFGKVEKQIKCEMIHTNLPKSASDKLNLDEGLAASTEFNVPLMDPSEESHPKESDDEVGMRSDEEIDGTSASSAEKEVETATKPFPSKQGRKPKTNDKKAEAKTRKEKIAKHNIILGSAKRLKIREKTLFTGVFSKYGANASVQEQR